MSPEEQHQRQRDGKKCDFYINLVTIVLIYTQDTPKCGMPIKSWLLIYFFIQMAHIFQYALSEHLDASEFMRQKRRLKRYLKRGSLVMLEIFHMYWILNGNFLYFSSQNNCVQDSLAMSYLMLGILIIGYFRLVLYTFAFVFILYFFIKRCVTKSKKQMMSVNIIKNLQKTKFIKGMGFFEAEEECIICWSQYEE
jgi:hypothetical protein